MKKLIGLAVCSIMATSLFAACTPTQTEPAPAETTTETTTETTETTTDATGYDKKINVITREEGSGTRGAFVEIVGLIEDDMDMTTMDAIVHDGTGKVMTAVAGDEGGIGYISLGSLNDTVKGLSIGGVAPSNETVASGDYELARPFNVAYKADGLDPVAEDFINFMKSPEAAAVIDANGVISMHAEEFTSAQPAGSITVGGSTSVSPVMEKLKEAYEEVNPNAEIAIESTGSTSGMTGAIDGILDIGMASRELKETEMAELENFAIATDGICVIVNNANPLEDITMEQVKSVYKKETENFNDLF